MKLSVSQLPFWTDIINRLNEQEKGSTEIEWLRGYNVEKIENNQVKRILVFYKSIKKHIKL